MNNLKKKFLIMFSCVFLFLPVSSYAAIFNATSCSVAAITTAIGSASAGDTVNVPAGDCSWNTTLTLNKEINLIGAGAGSTNITITGSSGYIVVSNGVDDWRISGFSFSTSTNTYLAIRVALSHSYSNSDWRIDHCNFTGFHYSMYIEGTQTGVIDHNNFYGGGMQLLGNNDTNWSAASNFGGSNFVFVEDNYFTDQGELTRTLHICYNGHGARTVFRYNTIEELTSDGIADAFDTHGYCHGSNIRGTRAFEVYKNTFIRGSSSCCRAMFIRAGTGLIYDNTFDETRNGYSMGEIMLYDYRADNTSVNGGRPCSPSCHSATVCPSAEGGEGWPCCDQVGRGQNNTSEPLYIWGNKDQSGNPIRVVVGELFSTSPDYSVSDYIQNQNRYSEGHGTAPDYFDNGTKPEGYSAYTYPHPLTSGGGVVPPGIPPNPRIEQ